MLLRFETMASRRRLWSKIEAKFRHFDFLKNSCREGQGEMVSVIFRARPMDPTSDDIIFVQGPLGGMGD